MAFWEHGWHGSLGHVYNPGWRLKQGLSLAENLGLSHFEGAFPLPGMWLPCEPSPRARKAEAERRQV